MKFEHHFDHSFSGEVLEDETYCGTCKAFCCFVVAVWLYEWFRALKDGSWVLEGFWCFFQIVSSLMKHFW